MGTDPQRCWALHLSAALFALALGRAPAVTHYVEVNSANATPPFTNWAIAATNIQDAVDAGAAVDFTLTGNGGPGAIGCSLVHCIVYFNDWNCMSHTFHLNPET